MTTAARPGQFTGATDNSANGGLFGDTKIDGIPDLVGADVSQLKQLQQMRYMRNKCGNK